jgi:hypothetical protein
VKNVDTAKSCFLCKINMKLNMNQLNQLVSQVQSRAKVELLQARISHGLSEIQWSIHGHCSAEASSG